MIFINLFEYILVLEKKVYFVILKSKFTKYIFSSAIFEFSGQQYA